jgi:hypothetical protein
LTENMMNQNYIVLRDEIVVCTQGIAVTCTGEHFKKKNFKYLTGMPGFSAASPQVLIPHLYDVFAEEADRVGHVWTKG